MEEGREYIERINRFRNADNCSSCIHADYESEDTFVCLRMETYGISDSLVTECDLCDAYVGSSKPYKSKKLSKEEEK